ncbi:acyl-CoA dehydrogenase family protein [Kibdelosporangium aridum]|uniref:Acyl-CoA dehydrogenase n=1 Tax=Kibdelosporangium aridum TaxID=2030 RepID=A0A1W2FBL6_KIBAR|nr:acyl-CoA dehydrogenase family protein [Kibdelosporangium aridum]SMD19335.1 Acyl-CoA dehydrogenase [Kibdelosporangium aridum]
MTDLVERAQWIAETVFLPDAAEVDARGAIPPSHFRVLAREGFYGIAAPDAGLDFETIVAVIETLAGGCLATTFTWLQHHVAVIGLANTTNESLRSQYYADLVAGRQTSGVASAGALADPPRLRASRTDGGWIFDGDAPFVSGWGIVDVLQITGNAGETVVSALVDAKNIPATRYDLVALDATATVRLTFDKVFVPDARIISEVPAEQFLGVQHLGSRLSGAMPTGLATRCARILEAHGRTEMAESIDAQAIEVRSTLDAALADPQAMFAARAAAANLAYRAAGAVFVAEGAASVISGSHGERLVREALFTLVTGSRAPMKNALLDVLTS